MFYCVYEIGGVVNDLWARREPPGAGTRRISPEVRVHMALFVSIRIAVLAFLLATLPVTIGPALIYTGLLGLSLAIYLLHSALAGRRRIYTFLLLKACRNCIPLTILVSRVPSATLAWLCVAFFVVDAPWRVYAYCLARGWMWERIARWRMRCIHVAFLCGVGAVLYLFTGAPHLLAVALYNALLECVSIVHSTRLRNRSTDSGRLPQHSPGDACAAECPAPSKRKEPCR